MNNATTVSWASVRQGAIKTFHEIPHAAVEQEIIDVFAVQPQVVIDAIERLAARVESGHVRSGWAVLRKELARAVEAPSSVTVELDDRERRVANAERWLRNAGVHFDRESEVLDELFGERGTLKAWAGDELLRGRLLELWRTLRPKGERAEVAELERAAEWKASRARVQQALRSQKERLETAQSGTRTVRADPANPVVDTNSEPHTDSESACVEAVGA